MHCLRMVNPSACGAALAQTPTTTWELHMFALDTAVRAMSVGLMVEELTTEELLPFAYADDVETIELLAGE